MRRDYGFGDLWLAASNGLRAASAAQPRGWSRRERMELTRAEYRARRDRPALTLEFGETDIGEPWAVLIDAETDEVALHVARLGAEVWAATPETGEAVSAPTLREAIARAEPEIPADLAPRAAAERPRLRLVSPEATPIWAVAALLGQALDALAGRRRAQPAQKRVEEAAAEKAAGFVAEIKRRAPSQQEALDARIGADHARTLELAAAAIVVEIATAVAAEARAAPDPEASPPAQSELETTALWDAGAPAPETADDAPPADSPSDRAIAAPAAEAPQTLAASADPASEAPRGEASTAEIPLPTPPRAPDRTPVAEAESEHADGDHGQTGRHDADHHHADQHHAGEQRHAALEAHPAEEPTPHHGAERHHADPHHEVVLHHEPSHPEADADHPPPAHPDSGLTAPEPLIELHEPPALDTDATIAPLAPPIDEAAAPPATQAALAPHAEPETGPFDWV